MQTASSTRLVYWSGVFIYKYTPQRRGDWFLMNRHSLCGWVNTEMRAAYCRLDGFSSLVACFFAFVYLCETKPVEARCLACERRMVREFLWKPCTPGSYHAVFLLLQRVQNYSLPWLRHAITLHRCLPRSQNKTPGVGVLCYSIASLSVIEVIIAARSCSSSFMRMYLIVS